MYSSLSAYQYSNNDPINGNDPTGAYSEEGRGRPRFAYTDSNPRGKPTGGSGSRRLGSGSGNHWSNQYNTGPGADEYEDARILRNAGFDVTFTASGKLAVYWDHIDMSTDGQTMDGVMMTGTLIEGYFEIGNGFGSQRKQDGVNGRMSDWISGAMWATNTTVGLVSSYTVVSGKFYKWNEVWHQTKTSGTATRWQKRWHQGVAPAQRAKQIQTVSGVRKLAAKLTYVGGILLVTDIAFSGELKPSQAINALMLGASTTGIGAIAAGAWFLADFGTMGLNYYINGEAKGIGDMLDDSVGTYEMYDGLY